MRRFDKLSADELWRRWREDIEQILQDAHEIFAARRMFRQIIMLYQNNPRLRETGAHVWDWMRVSYAAYMLMRIRRMTDVQANTISLGQLLSEVEARPDVITRARYIGMLNTKEKWLLDLNHKSFSEKFVGAPSRRNLQNPDEDFIDPALVAQDHADMMKAADRVRDVANLRVAHRTRVPIKDIQATEADEALDAIQRTLQKYYVLLHGSYVTQLEPVPQFDTNEVFTFPWLQAGRDENAEKK